MSADPEFSNHAQVWDVSTGVPLGGPVAHQRDISAAHFSADGSKLAVGTTRGEIRIWDARRGAPLTAPLVHPGWINSVRFSPDGAKLVSSSVEGTAMIWDAATGQVLTGPLSHGSEVWLAQFDPSGSRILTATTGHNARIWSVEGELLTDLPQGERAHSLTNGPKPELHWGICDPVEYAEFSPDGRRVVTAAGDRARIWDVSEGKQLTEMVHAQLVVMARFSPDGRRLLTASFDGSAQLWDVETGLKLADPIRHENHVAAIHLSADGRWAMTASNDGTAKVWELPSASLPVTAWFPALLESVAGLRLHPGSIATPVTWAETELLKSTLAAMPSTTPLVQWARLL
jgi:dipeptidyl aminopeptidase/acylaminoacyl peptidase